MPIISVSLDEKTLGQLCELEEELGFSGRSEAIRSAISAFIAENKQRKKLSGQIKAVVLAVHSEDAESRTNEIKHGFEEIIATQMHGNLRRGKCLEIFVLDGSAELAREFLAKMQSTKGVEYVKVFVP
ncbi:MAG: CopG family ribbon-helix-helix protein [Candidatus Micrarchaeota archaeon]|nr:CopG family ribbon-helix-helix protein [Candidatus Micrarchaeota archaeon]